MKRIDKMGCLEYVGGNYENWYESNSVTGRKEFKMGTCNRRMTLIKELKHSSDLY